MLFCSSEGRKCSKYGVHQGICVYICRFTKVTGNVLSICVFNVLSAGADILDKYDVLSSCPLLYVSLPEGKYTICRYIVVTDDIIYIY